ncbi:SDR family NAD(P)-dependent oxidoreductase, partial [Actinomadura sp. 9N215]|uniref:SDR family NAD(P)-dependent oxidoreductase n=1 Tax=Actinomadura sp. 9N215 TaxID=3375150 RepID=UPI0037AFCCC9
MASEEELVDYLKRVAAELHETRRRLHESEGRRQEPVAVVGMACRYPGGVTSPEGLWDLVASGRDAIGPFPANRGWDLERLFHPDPDHPGTSYAREGGFLHDADLFDAGFFGISPREALAMDPQQRLLLEVSWELFERAGIDPGTLKGTAAGVYVGTAETGFGLLPESLPPEIEGHLGTGNAPSVLSGRLAFAFGLEGPAMTVDTACSSSLVAVHLACQALRDGETPLAVAGGVTVMGTTGMFTEFSRQRGLAPDGRCKPFAATADGTGWSEGAGLVLLERLSDAERNGHRVLALIRGSAINQDGASNGLTAPNGPSQQRVIGQALASAGLTGDQIDAVEAHGTGTTLGDPIEAEALIATYGRDRPSDRPLRLGSVKSNLGHTQAAAGVAGLMKMVLAMRHGVLPASLHIDEPTPHVDWSSGGVSLLTERTGWPEADDRPRRAAVSSFGASGTNAHLIVEQAPDGAPGSGEVRPSFGVAPWVVSARSAEALRAQAGALAEFAEADPALTAPEVGRSLITARAVFEHRAVVFGEDRDELLAGLRALAADEPLPQAAAPGTGTVLVFPGQGSQWAGMGERLLAESPVFAARIAECERALAPHVDWSLTGMLRGSADLDRVDVVQPVLWAVMVSLAEVWRSFGVVPDAVVGHSQGEIAAACVAGALSLEDAAKVVALRSRALRALSGQGAMAALGVGEDEASRRVRGRAGVVVAAVNGPGSTVVSGPPGRLAELVAECEAEGLRARLIDVDYASHGPQVDRITDEVTSLLAGVQPVASTMGFYSTVTGERMDTSGLDAEYWVTNLRRPVRFADAVASLLADGHRVFAESSPHPVLSVGLEEVFEEAGVSAATVPTLRRDEGGLARVARSVGEAFTAGAGVDWSAWFEGAGEQIVDLPTYSFQRERFRAVSVRAKGDVRAAGQRPVEHDLLTAAVALPDGGLVLTGRLPAAGGGGWLGDHVVGGTVLVPGAGLVEWVLRAADETGCAGIEELAIQAPLAVPGAGGLQVRVTVDAADDGGRRDVRVHSRREDGDAWACHAEGVLAPRMPEPGPEPGQWPPPGARPLPVDGLYERAAGAGYAYGPAFQGVRAAWRDGDDLFAEVVLPDGEPGGFGIHPALLDAALHPVLLTAERDAGDRLWLPFAWTGVGLWATGATTVRVRLTALAPHEVRVTVADADGAPVLTADSVVTRPAEPGRLRTPRDLFALDWVPVQPGAPEDAALVVVETGGDEALEQVERVLDLAKEWLEDADADDSKLVVVTRGAMDGDPAGAAVWGLVRSAQTENPGRLVLVDLAPGENLDGVRALVAGTGEPQLAVRDGRVLAPRLVRTTATTAAAAEPVWDGSGTVLITGGTGVLGALLAEHLVREYGVRRLLLLSRSGARAPGAGALRDRLAELGAYADFAAADVADLDALSGVLARIPADRPLTGVVHAAGTVDDAVLASWDADRLRRVWEPKAAGARNLDLLTRDLDLRLFALFSSSAGVLGSAGQAGYAAANAYCDALAARRRADGLPAHSIAWGLWTRTSGLTRHLDDRDLARFAAMGLRPLDDADGLALFDAALRSERPCLVAAGIDTATVPAAEVPAPLRGLARPARRRAAAAAADGSGLGARLAGLDPADRLEPVLDVVRECAAAVLGHGSPSGIRADVSFKDLGFDSLTALAMRNRLSAASGLRLPATLVFDHPTPRELAALVCERLTGGSGPSAAARPAERAPAPVDDGDPIAIVAMACRYPGGVTSPERLWDLVASGRDSIGPFPVNRGWDLDGLFHPDPDHPGTSYAREGGFLHDADVFDAGFFGISPREALAMDPQQRLLLEVSWELFERAGIDPGTLKTSRTGVYAGVMYHDYGIGAEVEGYSMMGGSGSVVSGRVAYTFGLEGPAVTVDTACSSSLVAMHLACQALRQGECTLALAGGVTVMATPQVFTEFSRQRGLAPDGRCKPFAAAADGTGWSEGAGLVLLERLSDARRNNRRVLGVIRGSAVNQDGASNGLTAPNGPSQQRVIGQALASAGLTGDQVDAVEAHGTGTTLGDPIEAQALLAAYGQNRDRPLWLGSVKSNLGHTQAAAGVAGVMKMVLAMRHGVLPASLHIDEPTPHVDWSSGGVSLLTEPREWTPDDRPRRAGVSSFGASGTNAHLIVEQAPDEAPEPPDAAGSSGGAAPWAVSGRSAEALRAQAEALAEFVAADPALTASDVGRSLATTRAVFEHRAVVVGEGRAESLAGLAALARGEAHPALVDPGTSAPPEAKIALVFPGQGSQWPGMGERLLAESPVFAARIAECERALAPHVDWSLTEVLGGSAELDRVDVVQPVLWAVMVSLAAVWAEYGVTPDAVVGHSQGEIAAACVAGALSLEDAAKVVALRSRALRALSGDGAMASLGIGEDEASRRIEGGAGVVVAAVNGPDSTVVSGPPERVAALVAECEAEGLRARLIDVDYASHGPQVDRIADEVTALLAGIRPAASRVGFYSTVTGERIDTTALDAEYWVTNLRRPVRFADAVRRLLADGHAVFVESSPHPVLTVGIEETGEPARAVGTLRRNEGGLDRVARSMGEAFAAGADVDWSAWFEDGRTADLPTYAFQGGRYWVTAGNSDDLQAVRLADGGVLLSGRLAGGGWLSEHVVTGVPLVPGAALVEWALRAADEVGCAGVDELALQKPLAVPESGGLRIQVVAGAPGEDGRREVRVHSSPGETDAWECHAVGVLAPDAAPEPEPEGAWPPPGAEPVDAGALYERAAAAGYEYGPVFQGVRAVWRDGDDLLAEVVLPDDEHGPHGIHPALLDAALHPALLTAEPGEVWLPFVWSGVSLWATGATAVRVRLSTLGGGDRRGLRVTMADPAGRPVLAVESVETRPVDLEQLSRFRTVPERGLFGLRWAPAAATAEPVDWAAFEDDHEGPVPDVAVVEVPDEGDEDAGLATVERVLELLRRWLDDSRFADSRLALVTRGQIDAGAPSSSGGPVWGLVRSAQVEHPDRFLLVDLDPSDDLGSVGLALAVGEPQTAVREGSVLVPRLTDVDGPDLRLPVAKPGWRLDVAGDGGTLDDVSVVECPEVLEPLAPGQVRVAVSAAGLTFRDTLVALGMVPGQVGIGGEGAGVVMETAPDVPGLRPGDRVMGLFPGAFGPVAVTDARLLAPVPDGWNLREAAAAPVSFLTAWYGLVDLAGLSAGETVLIHAAAGGVGMAAVQIARHLGAEILATASPAKHGVLAEMGIAEADRASSRDLGFESVMRDRGVDVVLNSLAGEFVDASVRLLGEGGRFLEMGKTDIRDPERYPKIDYRVYDLVTDAGPDRIREMFAELGALFESDALRPLPVRSWPLSRAREAMRHLSQARHTGKLVLDVPAPLDPEGTVLITGGTGTLGGLVAEHLARTWGAKHLLLVSRRGPNAPGADTLKTKLTDLGAQVQIVAADLTDPATVTDLVHDLNLTAVIHTAAVLDDATLTTLTPDQLRRVWHAKATTARHLHHATRHHDLAAFVLFSSSAATLGSPGQAAYAAANAYLDALAHHRHTHHLPAQSIAWGLW